MKGKSQKQSSRKPRNYPHNKKQVRDDVKDSRNEKEVQHKYNDVSWYAKNPQMLKDAASLSYNYPIGNKIDYTQFVEPGGGYTGTLTEANSQSIPSLMMLRFVPTIGISNSSTSPANLAAQNIYSYVRYMNSGAKNYDQADLMLYLLAMDSIYMMWNWLKRMYGYAFYYSQYNRDVPKVLASGDNLDYNDFIANMADYRYQLNMLAARISSFCVPAVMPLFIRHSWLCSNIYKDSDNNKAQLYMFAPRVYYVYNETGDPNGGSLQANYLNITGTFTKFSTYLENLTAQLDAVAYSEDIGVMSGDILKAYGQDKLFKISPVEPDYSIAPVYNEEVLNQIHNSTLNSFTAGDEAGKTPASVFNITQNPNNGWLVFDPTVQTNSVIAQGSKVMLNMPWDDVTPENTMVATRLTAIYQKNEGTYTGNKFIALGSEFISSRLIFYMNESTGAAQVNELPYALVLQTGTLTSSSGKNIGLDIQQVSNFDWHPLTPIVVATVPSGQLPIEIRGEVVGMMGDITNFTIIDETTLNNMHTSALLSEFNVPQIGSF